MSYSVNELRELWQTDSLVAGTTIYSAVPNDVRPEWAANVLNCCCEQVASAPQAVLRILELSDNAENWSKAHDAFSAVRSLTLTAEQNSDAERRGKLLLYVAENAAKVVYNASGSAAPFDADSGAWLVRSAKQFSDACNSGEFHELLWSVTVGHSDIAG